MTQLIEENKNSQKQTKLIIQMEELNQMFFAKERRLKRYRDSAKLYKENRTFKNKNKNLQTKRSEKYKNKWRTRYIEKKQICCERIEKVNKNTELTNNMKKNCKELKKAPWWIYTWIHWEQH